MNKQIGFIVIHRNASGAFELNTFDALGSARGGAEKITRETGERCVITQVVAATSKEDVSFNRIETVEAV